MNLEQILTNVKVKQILGRTNVNIEKIVFDSRKIEPKSLFIAVKGTMVDGHQFIDNSIQKGAIAVVCETLPKTIDKFTTYILVEDSAEALGWMSTNFYDNPSKKLKLVAVTGTNGKTTTVTLLHGLFSGLGYKVGLLSTVENKIGDTVIPSTHTTPDAIQLNALLAKMVEEGCTYAFMEASSHAIHQHRITGLQFAGALFSNITHDHLDYHITFQEYIKAKKKLFDDLPKEAFALVNVDDKNGRVMVQNCKAQISTYSIRMVADFKARILENTLLGLHLDLDGYDFYARLIGEFNAYNLLCVYATAVLLGEDKMNVLAVLSNLKSADGRFDYIQNPEKDVVAIVDYAHTPDALEKVLMTIDKLSRQGAERIITVVGCGGDRDKTKRPKMAKIACVYSNNVILTSDNPRSESPEAILKDMEEGIPAEHSHKVLIISDRKQAIKTACQLAQQGAIILVAGKGHEKYQEINGVKHPFDDMKVLEEFILMQ